MAITLSRDGNGWTIFTPTTDSRIMYVSEDGNDGTGQVYDYNDFADPFNPTGEAAFATYSAANANARNGYPDWILFRRGDTFTTTLSLKNGKDADEFSLVGWYGASGDPPQVNPGGLTNAIINFGSDDYEYIAVVGIDFYNPLHDPDNPGYSGDGFGFCLSISQPSNTTTQFLFEGCQARFFGYNQIQHYGGGRNTNDILIRRCVFLDNWMDVADSQGLYMAETQGISIEECVLDHGGWYSHTGLGAQSTHNHNIYFGNCDDVTIRNCIITRGSNMDLKTTGTIDNIIVDENLFVDGQVGLSMAGNMTTPYRVTNSEVTNNIFTDIGLGTGPGSQDISWNFEVIDWDGGLIEGNLIMHSPAYQGFGIRFSSGARDTIIQDNIIYDLDEDDLEIGKYIVSKYQEQTYGGTNPKSNLTFQNNIIRSGANDGYAFYTDYSGGVSPFTFLGNVYYMPNISTAFYVNGTTYNFSGWQGVSGDNGTWEAYTFPDSTRRIETYMEHLGQTATVSAFLSKIRAMNRFNWDTDYTAEAVNAWIRAGFWQEESAENWRTSITLRF